MKKLHMYLRTYSLAYFDFYQVLFFPHLISEPSEKYKLNHATFHKLLIRQYRLSWVSCLCAANQNQNKNYIMKISEKLMKLWQKCGLDKFLDFIQYLGRISEFKSNMRFICVLFCQPVPLLVHEKMVIMKF